MTPADHATFPVFQRRRARRLAVWNGALWAIGNGLAGATLIIYLAREFAQEVHAERLGMHVGLVVGLILAAPQVAGLLRVAAPAMIGRLAGRKPFCIAAFLLSALLLAALPWTCAPGRLPSPAWSLAALILLWSLHHLMQYLGMVALWSWLADRLGNRPVMIVSQLLVAAGLLCYAAATPDRWLWLAGAAVLWIAYAGLNVCLPNLMLKLSPRALNTSYVAAFEGIRGLCYAASTVLGGVLVDSCQGWGLTPGIGAGLRFFTYLFLAGWVVRSLGALVLLLVIEPKAK